LLFAKQNIEQLLAPISDEAICGVYLKGDRSLYRPLRNEFNVALTSLRKLTQNPDASELEALHEENINNWSAISGSLMKTFNSQSRDIELIGWMLASQIILDTSMKSFSVTLDWFSQLAESSWDALHPILPEKKLKSETEKGRQDERCEAQLNAFTQLLGESEESSLLYAPILMMPIVGHITFYQYQSAEKRGELSVLRQQATREAQSAREEILALLANIAVAETGLEHLVQVTKRKAMEHGVNPPNFRSVQSLLDKVKGAVTQLTGLRLAEKSEPAPVAVAAETEQVTAKSPESASADVAQASVEMQSEAEASYSQQQLTVNNMRSLSEVANTNSMNRDKAFHQLRELAEFFRVSEPHSPVSFLIEKAIRWGYMPLPDLLNEMMAEKQGDTDLIFSLAGLDQTEQTVLPDVAGHAVSQKNEFAPVSGANQSHPGSGMSKQSAEQPADTEPKQQSETKKASGSSSSLRW